MATTNAKRIWDNYIDLFEVRKSDRIKFVVAAATRDGFRYINIREFYLRQRDNVWRPGRDGITIPLKAPVDKGTKAIFPAHDMLDAIRKTMEYVETMALSDPNHAVWSEPKTKENSNV